MADTNYDGIFGLGFAFTFTPSSGTAFGTEQAQVEEATTPPVKLETAKYTPISGSNSGVEQFAIGKYPVAEYKLKTTYSAAAHAAALTCVALKLKGSLVCTYGDGSQETYANSAITEVDPGPNTASGLRTAGITFTVPVPPVFSAGSTISVVQTTVALDAGALTIDLTASPYSGTDKAPLRAFFMNPSQNANEITIAIGASNGYDGFGSAFSITLQPGESVGLESSTDIDADQKTLDITGTGAQVLVIQLQLQ